MAKRVTYPWKLNLSTAGGPIEKKHPSRPSVYREISKIREEAANGSSRVNGFTVYQWDKDAGRWQLYERLPLTLEGQ